MPIKFTDYQAAFQWATDADGLPIANVLALGTGRWVTVCPLCGCGHDVTSASGDHYKPTCLLKRTHPKVYAAWVKRFPEASNHSNGLITLTGAASQPISTPAALPLAA